MPLGKIDLPGEPTSVDVLDPFLALVAVNTSESLTNPSGKLVVIRILSREIVAEIELGGQPDSIKISPDRRYAAIAIENERSEEICVGGTENGAEVPEDDDDAADACEIGGGVVGGLPQVEFGNPPGFLAIVDLNSRNPADWTLRNVDLTGLASYAPEDPEPEFVDINWWNEAAVSLQENNHIVVVDLPTGEVLYEFDAGTVDLDQIDATEDGSIVLAESLTGVPREPDALAWINGGIATANEGDLFGGSRGWSIFGAYGQVIFDAGNTFEHAAVQLGHYPEDRSENKGSEPKALRLQCMTMRISCSSAASAAVSSRSTVCPGGASRASSRCCRVRWDLRGC